VLEKSACWPKQGRFVFRELALARKVDEEKASAELDKVLAS